MRGMRRVAVALVAGGLLGVPVPAYGHSEQSGQSVRVDPVGYADRQAGQSGRKTSTVPTTPAVPCPQPRPAVARPPRAVPPPDNPADRAVGGAALATPGLATPAGAAGPPPVSATSWLVADLDSGAVVGGCDPHQYATPASVQKLLLIETMLSKLDPTRVVEVTADDMAFEPGSSAVGLVAGGRYTVETLWLGLLLNSGNDAANVLARIGGGADGLPGGLAAMNAEARRLGAYQTHAVTPSGLDGPGQFTSAYDLALIARGCFAREDFRRYVATRTADIPAAPPRSPKGFRITNDNQLLFRYPGALGGKTGYTDLARHTFVGAAERDGRRLVVTLVGAEAAPQRGWEQAATLLDWGFGTPRDARVGELVTPAQPTPTTGTAAPSAVAGADAAPGSGGVSWGPRTGVIGLALAGSVAVPLLVRQRLVRRRRRAG
ncbi:D-alanyl-D-alanine carboxypeptidase family protein [Plantactinospora sp. GCM10030261]|uniref:D-alanyl-D-alanine carboxypeptidase family protein n=1 Tax=Plantactinospora sp. GCM10030261 TaxID=3273420 RepID=UPI0036216285